MSRIRLGLVGAGSMGALHARVIAGSDDCDLVWVADPSPVIAERVTGLYGGRALLSADPSSVDAIVIAAPTEHHYSLALDLLRAGTPLLVEKPLTDDLAQTMELVEASREADVPLMCGLLERYNPAVRTAFDIADEPVGLSAVRHSPYVDRIRTGVSSDLLIHDVDLAIRLFGEEPSSVKAVFSNAHPRSSDSSEDSVSAVMTLPSGGTAEFSASRLSQRKVRTLTITEVERLIEVDLVRQDITIYRHLGLETAEVDGLGYRQQAIMEVPVIRYLGEPLSLQLQRFVDLIEGRADTAEERNSILPPHRVVESARASAVG